MNDEIPLVQIWIEAVEHVVICLAMGKTENEYLWWVKA
jgi:hypothetical protein